MDWYWYLTGLDKQVFAKLEEDCIKYNLNGDIMVMGDINAHINCNDYDFILNDSDGVLDSFLPNNYISDNHQPLRNTVVNQTTNSYGKNILDLCISTQMRILNGRTVGDSMGKATYFNYNGVTINDYCLCSATFLKNIINFQVGDFLPNLSDHCHITVNVFSKVQNNPPECKLRPKPFRVKWTKLAEEMFLSNLNNSNTEEIFKKVSYLKEKVKTLNFLENNSLNTSSYINELVQNFSGLIKNASIGTCTSSNANFKKKKKKPNKSWHDNECNIKLRHIKSLGRTLSKSPWNTYLRQKVYYEKKQYNKLIRKKYKNV